jgi:hypothetical protein
MRVFLIILFFLLSFVSLAQRYPSRTPYSDRDSVFIIGKVVDQHRKPLANALVLLSPFHQQKFDVTWMEQDTAYTNELGDFYFPTNGHQLSGQTLYFKKDSFQLSRHFVKAISKQIIIDTPVVLFNRRQNWFDSKSISAADVGITVGEAVSRFKINLGYSYLFKLPNSPVTGLRGETPDSSMILLVVDEYNDSDISKQNVLGKKVVGIGVAFPDGKTKTFGKFLFSDRKLYNEYYMEKMELKDN